MYIRRTKNLEKKMYGMNNIKFITNSVFTNSKLYSKRLSFLHVNSGCSLHLQVQNTKSVQSILYIFLKMCLVYMCFAVLHVFMFPLYFTILKIFNEFKYIKPKKNFVLLDVNEISTHRGEGT